MITLFIKWYLRREIKRCYNLSIASINDRADTNYCGKSPDYWLGYSQGLTDTLKVLNLESESQ